jgi:hypothetical protein
MNKDGVVVPLLFQKATHCHCYVFAFMVYLSMCIDTITCILNFNDITFPIIASMVDRLPRVSTMKYGQTVKYYLFVACHKSMVGKCQLGYQEHWIEDCCTKDN